MPYSPLLAGAIINAAPATTRIVGTFHIMPWSTLTKVGTHALGAIQRRQLTRFHEIIAVSQPAADFATTALHVTPTIIGNPVRMLGFNQAREAELNQSAELSANERVRIFFLGRLVERKGAGELLKAAVRLREITTTPFELVIAGKGPLFDTYLRYVAETGLDDITSFPGYIAEDDKPELLAAADIVALPPPAEKASEYRWWRHLPPAGVQSSPATTPATELSWTGSTTDSLTPPTPKRSPNCLPTTSTTLTRAQQRALNSTKLRNASMWTTSVGASLRSTPRNSFHAAGEHRHIHASVSVATH